MKDHLKDMNEEKGNPSKVYQEELQDKGNHINDSNEESDARDMAKMNKSIQGVNQKIDSAHPDDLKRTDDDDYALRETEDLK